MRHAFLLLLVRRAHIIPQLILGIMFGIDQTTVSHYLQLGAKYDDDIFVVTSRNIAKLTKSTKTTGELRDTAWRQGGEIMPDGTLVETTRPEDSTERKKTILRQGQDVCYQYNYSDKQARLRSGYNRL